MKKVFYILCIGILLTFEIAYGAILFEDDFDTDTSASWSVYNGSTSGTPDYTAEFSYDYSADSIPSAPNTSGGTTRGLKFTINNGDATAENAGVSAYPTGESFSGDFYMTVDVWLNFNASGSGTTEFATFGINHEGTRVNWESDGATASDGIWFGCTGDGDSGTDYRAYEGNPSDDPTWLNDTNENAATAGFLDPDVDGTYDDNNWDPLPASIFPSPPFEVEGAPGNAWTTVEVSQAGGVLFWKFDGTTICTRTNASSYTSGNIMLGYMDIYTSIANPAADAFCIFDNVKVEVPTKIKDSWVLYE